MPARHAHEPIELRLLVRRTDDGGLAVRTPVTPGWCMVAKTPQQLALVIEQAWAEVAIAAYARLRGVLYDLAQHEECIPAAAFAATPPHPNELDNLIEQTVDEVTAARRRKHPKTHAPEDWRELEDGRWLSPGGRVYQPTSKTVARVAAARST